MVWVEHVNDVKAYGTVEVLSEFHNPGKHKHKAQMLKYIF